MKIIITLFISFLTMINAQNFEIFEKYFEDSTLRIDYIHKGNAETESISLVEKFKYGTWAGSRKNLIDNFNNGAYYLKLYDPKTNKVIYSKGFDSYFKEYQTSQDAIEGKVKSFEEVALIPFPKVPVNFSIEKRQDDNSFKNVFSLNIDPKEDSFSDLQVDFSNYKIIKSHIGGEPHSKVDVVILGDGYTKEEVDKFEKDINHFTEVFFSLEPYTSMNDYFNIYGVLNPSEDSGVDEPRAEIYKETTLNSTFNSMGSERYLLTESVHTVYDVASIVPFDAIFIMANHKRYGGGGIYNFYCTFTSDTQFRDYIFLHEFGHSFTGLADEYYTSDVAYSEFYKPDREPAEPNITALLDKDNLKWKELVKESTPIPTPWNKEEFDLVGYEWQKERNKLNNEITELKKNKAAKEEIEAAEKNYDLKDKANTEKVVEHLQANEYYGKVGAFEGAGYMQYGFYRPMLDCIMFSKGVKPFCDVCKEAIKNVILHYAE
ncbi:MAG: IgA Peptidase M64 [Melioribacteraceae bacterium]|nr:IgA Peptidase M64 [Melioribacteraceae bacterium]